MKISKNDFIILKKADNLLMKYGRLYSPAIKQLLDDYYIQDVKEKLSKKKITTKDHDGLIYKSKKKK